jgi:type I restriction enzyme, S subunit
LSGRIDVDYYSPFLTNIRTYIAQSTFSSVSVADICEDVKSGFAAGIDEQAEDFPNEQRIPHLRPFSITVTGELSFDTQKYVPKQDLPQNAFCQKGEVLYNNTNSAELVVKATVFDIDMPCSCSNHVTRMKLKPNANPYYV